MTKKNTSIVGAAAEILVCHYLLTNNIEPFLPVVDTGIDIIARCQNNHLTTIQVKMAYMGEGDKIRATLRRNYYGLVDLLAIVLSGQIAWLTGEEIPDREGGVHISKERMDFSEFVCLKC